MPSTTPRLRPPGSGASCGARPIDVAFVGIGENGHLAFNDPPADFDDRPAVLVVSLDEACRRQQVGEGWFASVADVPASAISMSIRQIMQPARSSASCRTRARRSRCRRAIEGEVTPQVPASILQRHPRVTVYLDRGVGVAAAARRHAARCAQAPGDEVHLSRVLRSPGQRLRRRRLQRPRPPARTDRPTRSSTCAGPASRAACRRSSPDRLDAFARNARLLTRAGHPAIAGLHMEGPYLSPDDGPRGAHPADYIIRASADDFERRQEARRRPDRARDARAGGARRDGSDRASGGARRPRRARPHRSHAGSTRGGDRRRRDARDPSRKRLRADAAAPSQRDLDAAGGRCRGRELHRGRPSSAAMSP